MVVEGQSFVNSLPSYNSFNPGRFFSDASLAPFSIAVDKSRRARTRRRTRMRSAPRSTTPRT
ncbi:hypothetical protein ACRAWC_24620 [Leifsonia sp. L25]|uniref:hypothetical protein n=1 Tax=Leifsonia sp. L25 TaxID=3423957 RepID=UPI003D68B1C3